MENLSNKLIINRAIEMAQQLVPEYLNNTDDYNIANGNLAMVVIDPENGISGKMFGTDKVRMRRSFQLACTKAIQVWVTRMATGEFEKRLFNNEFTEEEYGIGKPDLIGWEGGQLIKLANGSEVAVGFSGFRGIIDNEIAAKAFDAAQKA
jgi:uncharacterized protein GlcG (DUF336 family)